MKNKSTEFEKAYIEGYKAGISGMLDSYIPLKSWIKDDVWNEGYRRGIEKGSKIFDRKKIAEKRQERRIYSKMESKIKKELKEFI